MTPRRVRVLESDLPPALAALIEEYLDEVGARVRIRTFEIYRGVLQRTFLPWLEDEGITEPNQLEQRSVSRWITYLRAQHRTPRGGELSEETIRTYGRTVNSFLKWLAQRAQVATLRAETPKRRRRVLDVLTPQEVAKLEVAAWTERDKLLIRLLFETGARLGEILALREADVRRYGRQQYGVVLRGKTGEREVALTPSVARRLERFVKGGRPEGYFGDHVFVGLRKLASGSYRTPRRGAVEYMVREAARKAGLEKRVHPHLLRHSAATHMLRQGMNALMVAKVLGHADLSMINAVYAHLSTEDAHAALLRVMSQDKEE